MFEWPYFPGAISGTLLFLAGVRAFDCWRELRSREAASFWALAGVGLIYLAIDEWFAVHEWVALQLFPDLGIVNHPDDVIIMGYAVTSMVIGILCWNQIVADRRVFRWLCGAAVATAFAGALDGFGASDFWLSAISEEMGEWAAGAMALTAMRMRLASARADGSEIAEQASLAAQIDGSVTVSQRSHPL